MDQLKHIPSELIEKAKDCKTPEELLALAQEEGYELSDEQLQDVSGGWFGKCSDHTPTDCWREDMPRY